MPRNFIRGLRVLLSRRAADRDTDAEVQHFIDEARADAESRGMTAVDAERAARLQFGNVLSVREEVRSHGWEYQASTLFDDLRQAVRTLTANRGFALVAILSLGLGIGANTAIFSLIDAVMLRSLPVSHPETLIRVGLGGSGPVTNPIWEQVRDRHDLFAGATAYGAEQFNLGAGGEHANGYWVSGNFFSMLGVAPMLGRAITAGDDLPGCPATAAVSYGFWQSQLGGATSAIGQGLLLNGHRFTVIGVVDPAFSGLDVGQSVQVYLPICSEPVIDGADNAMTNRSWWFLNIVARPMPGATLARTNGALAIASPAVFQATVPQSWRPEMQANYLKNELKAVPSANGFSELRLQYSGALRVLMVVVGLVLLIACANVANLLLARATVRQHEGAIRQALGASRGRLVRKMLTEAVVLSLLGAALGLVLARTGAQLLTGLLSVQGNAVWLDLGIDYRVLCFTTAVAVLCGVGFGLAPAWRLANADPQAALAAAGRSIAGRSRRGIGTALVAGQVALSFVLLTAAGLLLGSFRNLMSRDLGFQRDGIVIAGASVASGGAQLSRDILERVRALPGVRAASLSLMTPMSHRGWNGDLETDRIHPDEQHETLSWFNGVSEGYLATMGVRLVAGRDISASDNPTSLHVAVVSASVARLLYGTADPIGQRFTSPQGRGEDPAYTIVGVVQDSKWQSVRDTVDRLVYVPMSQAIIPANHFTLEVRGSLPPAALLPGIKSVFNTMAPAATVEYTTMSAQFASSLARDRLLATLAGFFGGLALLLALIGLYGTMAYSVARRRNEIGIRIALGAARERVVGMVLREVGAIVTAGLAVGAVLALVATRLVASFLFGLKASDPATWLGAGGVLLGVALVAGGVPGVARRTDEPDGGVAEGMNPGAGWGFM